ncbi:MAG: polysaccharide biosynthesis protein [Sphingobacteriales bacterium 17-39-43]|uniref:oligosaccharide flippase family protein n=1 Tax=Daejeonella sp. TaxID=2805397 RepID=UPI000BC43F21|nr:oligosaccharide flippase family protein [Daejeonella sp.]OYZ31851.1 MAG: polysaccharide biosynthesis protein [Sphingobacteriales bacterium 16-39-50]OYZ57283.1 MAG: polysaccharide biosynthesis protein [Sphingobacteriales bacterium 24-40-4]OZA24824.1 MAG: polysaccharide biosynthesis protein [Sphingobacteriales bacterium 17-39-43]HQS05414.1 oligosaccharide flippase family protein [Daejeonella sp.]HQT23012.1 oligosaccharide flippase family protein [Daejeonella sp.]
MSAIKKFAGQTAIYGISTVIARFLNFFLTPVYVGLYSPKVYGIFSLMYSWASMFNALLAFGMETTYFRYLNKYENDKQKVYNNTFFTVSLIAFTFLLFSFLFVGDIAAWMQRGTVYDPDYARYIKYFIYILVADVLAVIPFAKLRADGRSIRYSIIKFTNIVTFIGLNLLFIFVFPMIIKEGWFGAEYLTDWYREGWVGYVFISNLIASLITLLLLMPELLKLTFSYDISLLKEMLVYSLPVLIANISFIINENIDKVFLGQLLPAEIAEQEVGIYAACYKIAVFLSIFINAFRLGAEPFFFSQAKNKNATETYARIMDYFVIAVSLIFVFLVANIELLKYFIYKKDASEQALYWSGLKIVPILLFGYVSLGIYINLSIWYKLSDQTRYGLYISGIGAILTIILNIIFIPKFSYMASAWISLTAYTVMMILSYLWGQRNYPIPYKLKKNIIYLLASICIVFVAFVVFDRNLIVGNALFLIFTVTILFTERKEIKLILGTK